MNDIKYLVLYYQNINILKGIGTCFSTIIFYYYQLITLQ